MKLLEILLERPGEMIPREVLRVRIWPNESFGDFDQAVNVAVTKLRAALGDSAENPRYIETLPKRGYRFIAQVTTEGGVFPGREDSTPANVSGEIGRDSSVRLESESPPDVFHHRAVGHSSQLCPFFVLRFLPYGCFDRVATRHPTSGPWRFFHSITYPTMLRRITSPTA